MKRILVLVAILAFVGLGAAVQPTRPPVTAYTIYAQGMEFRSNEVTIQADGLEVKGFWEKIGGRWYERHYEGLQIHGDYILRQGIVRAME